MNMGVGEEGERREARDGQSKWTGRFSPCGRRWSVRRRPTISRGFTGRDSAVELHLLPLRHAVCSLALRPCSS